MLRISTLMQYRTGEARIIDRQRELLQSQGRIASGRRISSPADDPLGAADASSLRSALSRLAQFEENQGHARFLLNQGESLVAQLSDATAEIREKLIAAGNAAYGDVERRAIADHLQGIVERMIGIANSSDGAGGYLLAGAAEGAPPFARSGNVVSYVGDQTLQAIEVANGRRLRVKLSGDDLLAKIRPGNGTFTTAADAGNNGTGNIDAGAVGNPALLTGSGYTIDFDGVRYVVTRLADSAVTNFAAAASGPTTIDIDGMRVTLNGTPAAGDRFTLAPAGYRSLFDSVAQAIDLLRQPLANPAARAQFAGALAGSIASIGQAADHLLLKRAEIGSALAELDDYAEVIADRSLESQGRLSAVEDLDYAQAASELARRQTAFEAAIKSYSVLSKLSLFDTL